jgi:hypothetical protein
MYCVELLSFGDFFLSSGVIVKVMVILLLWCSVDFHGCGLFILIGFFPSSWLNSFLLLFWCPVDFRGCGLFMLIVFFPRVFLVGVLFATVDAWFLRTFFLLIFCGECCVYGIDVLVSLVS